MGDRSDLLRETFAHALMCFEADALYGVAVSPERARSAGPPTSSAFSPTAPRSSASSVRCLPNSGPSRKRYTSVESSPKYARTSFEGVQEVTANYPRGGVR
jgi:hypothetical protein